MTKHTRTASAGKPKSRARQWMLVGGVVAVGAALSSQGVFAAWVATSQATTGAAGAASLAVTQTDTNGTVFSSGVSNMLPGDYIYRYARMTNTGALVQDFSAAVTGTGALSAAGGLQVAIDSCSVPWAGDGSCGGTLVPIATIRDVAGSAAIPLGQVAAGSASNLRYKFGLSATADQATFQGTSGNITVTISGSTPILGGRDRTVG